MRLALIATLDLSSLSDCRRFQFTRDEIQAFREEQEQRNGDLSKPEDDAASSNARVSAVKRPIDLRWSVSLKDPLPKTSSGPTYPQHTPIELLQKATTSSNDPSHYRSAFFPSLFTSMDVFLLFRVFFERDQIIEHVQETRDAFDNDVCLLYYLKIIKNLRAKESDLRSVPDSVLLPSSER